MNTTTILALTAIVGPMLSAGGVIAWFKLGPERRQINTNTQSKILDDLSEAYTRISEELQQAHMQIKACEVENETCRKQIQDLQSLVGSLQADVRQQSRLSALSRARAHTAAKTLGNYELHIDFLLDEMRKHEIEITPIMRTQKLRTAFQAQMERLEAMEVQELENLLKQQTEEPPM